MKTILTIFGMLLLAGGCYGQGDKTTGGGAIPQEKAAAIAAAAQSKPKVTITAQSTPLELAKAAQTAHGGEKFKTLKSLMISGTADASAPGSTQTISATFLIATAGDMSRFELNNPVAPFTQIFDGQQLFNSLPQIQIPPMSRLGIAYLQQVGEKGYTISALPDKKKKRGFKIATADGYSTDFYIDATTGLVDSMESKFTVQNREVSTAVIVDKYREVDGLMIPEKFSQRIDFSGMAAYAAFKAREILVNSTLPENTFVIPQ